MEYQPSGEGGTRSPPAKSKMAAEDPKNAVVRDGFQKKEKDNGIPA